VLGCTGSGTNSGVIAGMDWVANNHVKPAVANMSLGGGASQATDDAVARMVNAGVTVAVAAGNDNSNACNYSPARAASAITVGSTTNTDARSSFSNYGTCLDIFAPGSSITSAWYTSSTATNTISGTSMASPHVAGVAALYLASNPSATPAQVTTAIVNNATPNVVTSPGTGSPNRLLYSLFGSSTPTYTISGTITTSAGAAISGVTVSTGSVSATTNSSGAYTLSGLSNGTYTLTPSLSGYTFSPTSRSVTVNSANVTGQNFTGTASSGGGVQTYSNGTDYAINDNSTVSSPITVSGRTGNGSATTPVAVNIIHTYRGDLVVDLVAPDGSVYNLLNRSGGSADNVNQTFNVNLSGEALNGTWNLRVRDAATIDTGRIDSWSITF
jgi:subtilisin family serine protease